LSATIVSTPTVRADAGKCLARVLKEPSLRIPLGTDKACDVAGFFGDLRDRNVTPHIAVNGAVSKTGKRRMTAVDGLTTRHVGYSVRQRVQKRVEEVFGFIRAQAGHDQVKGRGRAKAEALFTFAATAYNLLRIPKLFTGTAL
jgi:hypothetical protein